MQTTLDIRELTLDHDFEAVSELYEHCADYLALEQGRAVDDAMAMDFFTDRPPDHPIEKTLKLGLFDGDALVGVADLALGYPSASDAFIGLLLLDQRQRGAGLGANFLRHLIKTAHQRGANTLYLAVLDQNPRARAFWEREGFTHHETLTRKLGARDHVLHRMISAI